MSGLAWLVVGVGVWAKGEIAPVGHDNADKRIRAFQQKTA